VTNLPYGVWLQLAHEISLDSNDTRGSSDAPIRRPFACWQHWRVMAQAHFSAAQMILKAAGGDDGRAALAHAIVIGTKHAAAAPDLLKQTENVARLLTAIDLMQQSPFPMTAMRELVQAHHQALTASPSSQQPIPNAYKGASLDQLVKSLSALKPRAEKINALRLWVAQAGASQLNAAQTLFKASAPLRSLWQDNSIAGDPNGVVFQRHNAIIKANQLSGSAEAFFNNAQFNPQNSVGELRHLEAHEITNEQAVVNAMSYDQWVQEMPALLKMLVRYDDNLLRSMRDQAPSAADWQRAREDLVRAGVSVPADARLDLVLPYKPIVMVTKYATPPGLEVAGSSKYSHNTSHRDAALLARASPRDEWQRNIGFNGYPEELHRTLVWAALHPLEALHEAYPEVTHEQLRKVPLYPQEKYPKVGVEPVLTHPNLGFDKSSGFVRQADGSMFIPRSALDVKWFSKAVHARQTDGQTVPRYVFRGDRRTPDEVRQSGGLYGHSNNASLGMHIFNDGRIPRHDRQSRSAFVSFTGNFFVAARFAGQTVYSRDQIPYIYMVKPDALISKDVAMPGGGKLGFSGKDENEFTSFGTSNDQIAGYYELRSVEGGAHVSPLLDYQTGQPVPARKHPKRNQPQAQ
jgi:Heat-labile enterotoxin alpha chain